MNRIAIIVLAAVAVASTLMGCSNAKKIAAHIGSEEITEAEFYERVQNVNVAQLGASYQSRSAVKAGDYAMMTLVFENDHPRSGPYRGNHFQAGRGWVPDRI